MTRSQRALAGFFSFAGIMHFVIPRQYEATMPPYIKMDPKLAVQISGVAELVGGLLVIAPATRSLARWGLLALLVAVFPANVYMATNPEEIKGLDLNRTPRSLLWARLPVQPLFMLWVWRATK